MRKTLRTRMEKGCIESKICLSPLFNAQLSRTFAQVRYYRMYYSLCTCAHFMSSPFPSSFVCSTRNSTFHPLTQRHFFFQASTAFPLCSKIQKILLFCIVFFCFFVSIFDSKKRSILLLVILHDVEMGRQGNIKAGSLSS